jgi:cytochrome c-type biogenesis protein
MHEATLLSAFGAGLLTFFAPCTFVTLPIFLAYLGGATSASLNNPKSRLHVAKRAIVYALGFLLVFTLMGLTASGLGLFLLRYRAGLTKISALLILLFGLLLVFAEHLKPVRFLLVTKRLTLRPQNIINSYLFAFGVGMTSAFAWTPCIGPVLGSILFYAGLHNYQAIEGGLLLFFFGLGMILPMLLLSLSADLGQKWVHQLAPFASKLQKITGLLLIGVALTLLLGWEGKVFQQIYKWFVAMGYQPS